MEIQSAYQEELEKLERVLSVVESRLKKLEAIPRYYGEDFTEQAIDAARQEARRKLSAAVEEPYFGRLDFQEANDAQARPYYIGKLGVENESNADPLVIDWRAPIASLFYSFSGGEETVSYEAPDGTIEGTIDLKRNLMIRKKNLQRVVDTFRRDSGELSVNDEFLLYRLGENKDNKLRDIVSTIQAEQDQIIRSPKNTALVIQGVAGSGKTTVALHRLAFLLYQYRGQIRAEKMVIFAPNRMFLDYISSVLPELGVGHIQQTTFEDWALQVLSGSYTLTDNPERLAAWFAYGPDKPVINDDAPGRFKGSITFMNAVEEAFALFEQEFIPDVPFEPWEGEQLTSGEIREWFYTEYRHYPVMKRKERLEGRIKRWIEMRLNETRDPNARKERKRKSTQRLKAYWKLLPEETPYSFYTSLFPLAEASASKKKTPSIQRTLHGLHIPAELAGQSQSAFKKSDVFPEDLPPLLLLHDRMYGISGDHHFDHVVIDEAQDFSPFQIQLLYRHTSNGSFTILGDLSQGIHAYKGIRSWNEFLDLFNPEARAYYTLSRSYRSTMEIVKFANMILKRGIPSASLADPVFRSGDKVKVLGYAKENRTSTIARTVRKLLSGELNTVALIGRTEQECKELHTMLLREDISATLISADRQTYEGGLSIVPVYLSKGLEFDAVVLTDANADHYGLSEHDAKLLYVGCTRALHDLWVLYDGEPSPLLPTAADEDIVSLSV